MREALTFDDVLLVPQHSAVLPSDTCVESMFSRNIPCKIPLSSSAMDTVTESHMASTMSSLGGIGVIHKNNSIEQQCALISAARLFSPNIVAVAAIGVSSDWRVRLNDLISSGVRAIVLDSAHGHSENVLVLAKTIKKDYPNIDLIVGNIATAKAAKALCEIQVDALKVGIGPGSICTTRIVSGIGVPQLTAIMDVVQVADQYDIPVIADGGIKHSGDVVKALAAGASSVMIGSLFAGTEESPGDTFVKDDIKYKTYRGMGSEAAMEKGSKDRYFQSDSKKLVPEGVEGYVKYKGSVVDVVYQLIGGLRSGMGYCGAKTIQDLQRTAEFVKITPSGLKESHVHDLSGFKSNKNYGIES